MHLQAHQINAFKPFELGQGASCGLLYEMIKNGKFSTKGLLSRVRSASAPAALCCTWRAALLPHAVPESFVAAAACL